MHTTDGSWPERPEADFMLPHLYPTDYDCRGRTQCDNCSAVILLADALNVIRTHGHEKHVEHYCGEACANDACLESLRRNGL